MKLQQGQLWDLGGQYVRIVILERLAVEYKTMQDPVTREGIYHRTSKKEFCTLIKKARLVPPGEEFPALDAEG